MIRGNYRIGRVTAIPGLVLGPRRTFDYELVRINTGSVQWEIDGTIHKVRAGEILMAHPDKTETWKWDSLNPTYHDFIHFELEANEDLPLPALWPTFSRRRSGGMLHALFDHVFKLNLADTSGRQALLDRAVEMLIYSFIYQSDSLPEQASYSLEIEGVLGLVYEGWERGQYKPPSIEDMCKAVNISKPHLIRLFRRDLQETPTKLIERLRLHLGSLLLLHTSRSVEHISKELCYETQFHFSRNFKRYAGNAPLPYRKDYQGSRQMLARQHPRFLHLFHRFQQATNLL